VFSHIAIEDHGRKAARHARRPVLERPFIEGGFWPILSKYSPLRSRKWSRRKPELSKWPRIDDRASGSGQTTPDDSAGDGVGEFFERNRPKAAFAKAP
jgi:hypothetical protein